MKNYPGAKGISGHLQQIVSLIPKCDVFVEAMAGSAVISDYISGRGTTVVTNDYDASLPVESHLHYRDLVAKYDCEGSLKTVFYFDPPYLMATRSYQGKLYLHDWNDQDHADFLTMVRAVKSDCMISHYPCKLYDDALQGWRKYSYSAMTRAGKRTECVYMNFVEPLELLTCSVVGINRTDRQQIKRKVARLIAKIQALPIQHQQGIITAIQQKFHQNQ
jgi:hypothetical protein